MADENFKESFGIGQLVLLIVAFLACLCLPPIISWVRFFS
jgi:hypothetical protein